MRLILPPLGVLFGNTELLAVGYASAGRKLRHSTSWAPAGSAFRLLTRGCRRFLITANFTPRNWRNTRTNVPWATGPEVELQSVWSIWPEHNVFNNFQLSKGLP